MKQITLFLFYAFIIVFNSKAQPGALDTSFGKEGIVITTFSDFAKQAIQNDGKIIVVSHSSGILVRYLPDGSLDSSFGENGRVILVFTGETSSLAIQPDGKIVVGGGTNQFPIIITLYRFLPDGRIDSSFGNNGIVLSNLGGWLQGAIAIAIQQDNKIVVTGDYSQDGNNVQAYVARYDTNGSLDSSFGSLGKTLISTTSEANSIALQKDEKILIGGTNGLGGSPSEQFFLARFETDGQLDKTFGNNGWEYSDFDVDGEHIHDIALQPDGKIIAVGAAKEPGFNGLIPYMAVARYNDDGSYDESFGDSGKAKLTFKAYSDAFGVALQQNGKIVIAGFKSYTNGNFVVARFLENGVLDSAFATNGAAVTDLGTTVDQAHDIDIQKDGKIVAGGSPGISLVRYLGDPVKQSLITRIKRWIRNHILNFQDLQANNTAYYVVERSNNNSNNFKEIAKVEKSEVGNQKSETYSYLLPSTVNSQQPTENYYRIKAVDNDGSVAYSDVISETDNNSSSSSLNMYPNPVKDVLHVSGLNVSGNTSITIVNEQGNVVKRVSANTANYQFNVKQLQKGTYYLKVNDGRNSSAYQFIKE